MQLTLQELFGEGSYQDINKVVINKNSLPLLIPNSNNSAQALFAALLEKARVNYHAQLSTGTTTLTIDGYEPIEYDASVNYDFLNVYYSRNQINTDTFNFIYKVVIRELI
ncbi:MAG: hypothetical protein KME29_03835 [Calothrix sp. FI2-JRJ7]|jgi:hypothetical protein|nr:hypothetical protein [Calothrix sp. FI2-JRJ7]MBW4598751.1 hypothetical protein [Calothrix sp. FI2-JRJ7]